MEPQTSHCSLQKSVPYFDAIDTIVLLVCTAGLSFFGGTLFEKQQIREILCKAEQGERLVNSITYLDGTVQCVYEQTTYARPKRKERHHAYTK